MSTRKAEVKGYVLPNVKEKATKVYAHWGISLSDAINAFLIKSIDVGGFPFDMKENIPTYETLGALEELEDMEKNPEKYASYSNVDDLMKDLLL